MFSRDDVNHDHLPIITLHNVQLRLTGQPVCPLLCRYLVINQSTGQAEILTRWWHKMKSQGITKAVTVNPAGEQYLQMSRQSILTKSPNCKLHH